jgi:hypothetical protein
LSQTRIDSPDYQLAGARQTLQCVGEIKIGSSAQALYQTPDFRRHGKRSGATPDFTEFADFHIAIFRREPNG